jgi:hypothetical protein
MELPHGSIATLADWRAPGAHFDAVLHHGDAHERAESAA